MVIACVGHATGCGSDPSPAVPDAAVAPDAPDPPLGPVGLQDVSVLLPLPSGVDDPSVLTLQSRGNGGPLFDMERFDKIPGAGSDRWRIVAARIDPCFPDLALLETNPAACRHQLRLTAQPLLVIPSDGGRYLGADDMALQLMYDLSVEQFDQMSKRWLRLATPTTNSPSQALGVHAQISSEGLAGPTATALRAIILAYAGSATLSDVFLITAIGGGVGPHWHLVAEHDGQLVGGEDMDGNPGVKLFPDPFNLLPLLGPDPATSVALQTSLDIDNPAKPFNINTVDCGSCHLADYLRSAAERNGASTAGLDAFSAPPFNLANTSAGNGFLRAFGYRDFDVSWNQRVINESARVAAYFNAKLETAPGQ